MRVIVPYPVNICDADKKLFSSKQNYDVQPLEIKKLRDVFISHEGLCLKNMLLVAGSHFNLTGNEDSTFYYSFYKLALEQYLVSTFGKSLKKIVLDKGDYLHIYTKWFGYFFWITDALPKLIKTQHLHSEVKLLYPSRWDRISFVSDVLNFFPDLKIEKIPEGVHMQVKNLILPETRKWSNGIDPKEIKSVRNFIIQQLKTFNVNLDFGQKIYISRNKAARRKPQNNDEVEKLMSNLGFKTICLEDFSFLEQMSIMRNAKYVVGLHGAGLANTIMLEEGGGILEISPVIVDKRAVRIPFWRLANAVKANYYILFCSIAEKSSSDVYDSNLNVDLKKLDNEIKKMLNKTD